MSPPVRRPARGAGARRPFGATWWGRAWTDALEQRARLDPNRLPRGRTYARHARVGAMTVEAGELRAPVLGSRSSAYRVRIRVRQFTGAEWDRVVTAIAARAGHAAALLDGELTPEIVADVAAAGLDLLPGAGEIGTSCSCPDWANPCKHAAAVCYLVADLLDDDPFILLLLHGRGRDDVMAALRRRRSGPDAAHRPAEREVADPGMTAAAAWAPRPGPASMLPTAPPVPERAGRPAPLATDPPTGTGIRLDQVVALASDAARRAAALLAGDGLAGFAGGRDADLGRRADQLLGTPGFDGLARAAGVKPTTLVSLATGWRHGGAAGVAVLRDLDRHPPAEAVDAARAALAAAGWSVRGAANGDLTVVGTGTRLRLGHDGRWYRLERRRNTWDVAAPPDPDPMELVGPVA